MNCYEHTLIAKQDLSKNNLEELVEKYQKLITENYGKLVKVEEWGLMNLAQIIDKSKKGYYYHFKFNGNGQTIKELENKEKIDSKLLRYLTVKVKKFDLKTEHFKEQNKLEK